MEVIILPNLEDVAKAAADVVEKMIESKRSSVLGLATGNTPVALYRELVRRHREEGLSFSEVTTFNLDEYLGLDANHRQSYRSFMDGHLFEEVDIDPRRTHFPACENDQDPRSVGPDYERNIREANGIDLQILGLGSNGHIGFNEPTSSLNSRTRVKTLAPHTIRDNSRYFSAGEFQPHLAITMGIASIVDARRVLLMATGEGKAAAVAAMVEGPVSSRHPASALQYHQRVRVFVDEAAAGKLELFDYYKWVRKESNQISRDHGGSYLSDPWFTNQLNGN